MPYIEKKQRLEVDELLDALVTAMKKCTNSGNGDLRDTAGVMNYVVTRMIIGLMGDPAYWKVAMVAGVLSNIKDEFYRRAAVPYENKKIKENGDVSGYDRPAG